MAVPAAPARACGSTLAQMLVLRDEHTALTAGLESFRRVVCAAWAERYGVAVDERACASAEEAVAAISEHREAHGSHAPVVLVGGAFAASVCSTDIQVCNTETHLTVVLKGEKAMDESAIELLDRSFAAQRVHRTHSESYGAILSGPLAAAAIAPDAATAAPVRPRSGGKAPAPASTAPAATVRAAGTHTVALRATAAPAPPAPDAPEAPAAPAPKRGKGKRWTDVASSPPAARPSGQRPQREAPQKANTTTAGAAGAGNQRKPERHVKRDAPAAPCGGAAASAEPAHPPASTQGSQADCHWTTVTRKQRYWKTAKMAKASLKRMRVACTTAPVAVLRSKPVLAPSAPPTAAVDESSPAATGDSVPSVSHDADAPLAASTVPATGTSASGGDGKAGPAGSTGASTDALVGKICRTAGKPPHAPRDVGDAAAQVRRARSGKRAIDSAMVRAHYDAFDLLLATKALSAADHTEAEAALGAFSREAGASAPVPRTMRYTPAGGGEVKSEPRSDFTPLFTSGLMNACLANAVSKHVTGHEALGIALRTVAAQTACVLHDVLKPLLTAGRRHHAAALLGVNNDTLPHMLQYSIAQLRDLAKGSGSHMMDHAMAFLLAVATQCSIRIILSDHGFECLPPLHNGPATLDTIWLFYDAREEARHYALLWKPGSTREPMSMRDRVSQWVDRLRGYVRQVIERKSAYDSDALEVIFTRAPPKSEAEVVAVTGGGGASTGSGGAVTRGGSGTSQTDGGAAGGGVDEHHVATTTTSTGAGAASGSGSGGTTAATGGGAAAGALATAAEAALVAAAAAAAAGKGAVRSGGAASAKGGAAHDGAGTDSNDDAPAEGEGAPLRRVPSSSLQRSQSSSQQPGSVTGSGPATATRGRTIAAAAAGGTAPAAAAGGGAPAADGRPPVGPRAGSRRPSASTTAAAPQQ